MPAAHRRRLRTTNGLERLNKEIKRRTRVATLFPKEASLLRLASAVLSEISDDWETERAYLTMEARGPTSENPDLQKGCCFIRSRRGIVST
jgi:transposase-like protein